jgi:hypothetical protein
MTFTGCEAIAEATAPKQKLNNGGHNDATGSAPPLTAIADVWTIA